MVQEPLKNRRAVDLEDAQTAVYAARHALKKWYERGSRGALQQCVSHKVADEMRASNLQSLENRPDWIGAKHKTDAYVMLFSQFSGCVEPVALRLTYNPIGGLPGFPTRRELHQQLRAHLQLHPIHSLRICVDRPWYKYWTLVLNVPEKYAIPADDVSSIGYCGLTLRHYVYTHLTAPALNICPKCRNKTESRGFCEKCLRIE